MCDLIDLNSPDRNGLLGPKLASPLIPTPMDTEADDRKSRANLSTSLMTGKRDSLDNNPFDMVLCKTTEYNQKKDDPFEVALEKALNAKRKNAMSRTASIDLTDCAKECKRNGRIPRMNKTLDEPTMMEETNSQRYWKNMLFSSKGDQNVAVDSGGTNVPDDKQNSCNAPGIAVCNADLSILNQSLLNDTLLEASPGHEENKMKSVFEQRIPKCIVTESIDADRSTASNGQVPKLRRSFSCEGKISPCNFQTLNPNSLSPTTTLGTGSTGRGNLSSVSSVNSVDLLNEGFWKSRASGSSILSTLSNVSIIRKLSSVSSITNSILEQLDTTVNRAFLENCPSEKTDDTRLDKRMDFTKDTNCIMPRNSTSSATKLANNRHNTSNKLIDVDVFLPNVNCSKEECRSSISDSSSDSVFLEGGKINKSILCEAKAVARRFEELALKSSSGSSIDDLIASNPLWVSELLPAFDEEDMVGNLIELPTSPNTSGGNVESTNREGADEPSRTNDNENCTGNNKLEDKVMRDLETELIEPIAMEKKITATTLLLDLKKLIKTENNAEANKLLENLERALGVECKSNTELLATYLNTTNNLAKSPKKINENLEIVQNVKEVSKEKESKEENFSCADYVENFKESSLSKHSENGEKCLSGTKGESINISSETHANSDTSNEKSDAVKNSKVNITSTPEEKSNSLSKTESDPTNEKLAMELLTNLGKLLNGQTEEQSAAGLLRNLGKVLTFATSSASYNVDNRIEIDNNHAGIQQTPKKSKLKPENKMYSSILSKSTSRLSLDLEAKNKSSTNNMLRRSSSASQTLPLKVAPSSLISKRRSTSQLKEIKKRFSSDPGFINSIPSKKDINSDLNGSKIDNRGKDERTKSISVAVAAAEREKPMIVACAVKSKLKKKTGGANKKGPMKAVLPIGNMQRMESFGKKVSPSGIVTPPKSHKIISSTPNALDNECPIKRSPRSKPVASSTPDFQNSKARKVQSQLSDCSKKRNFSCDISPVTVHVNADPKKRGTKSSPKKINKLPSPKRTTPKRQPADSSIPKPQTPPVIKRMSSSFEVNQCDRVPQSPQRYLNNISNSRKASPIPVKQKGEKIQQSPLRDSNKLSPKVKPFNLITKLRRHSVDTNIMEKENTYI